MQLYELFIHVEPTPENEQHGEFLGAYTYLYLPALDLEHAIERMKVTIADDQYHLKDIDAVQLIETERWQGDPAEGFPTLEELESLIPNNDYYYTPFHCYAAEYEH